MFLMPGVLIALYATGSLLPAAHTAAMQAYLRNHQQTDGGWGTHIECASTMFGTVLSYVSLRVLGVPADDTACIAGRAFIQQHGGALQTVSWAKFWLALLGECIRTEYVCWRSSMVCMLV
jgi:cycloartenol synthase